VFSYGFPARAAASTGESEPNHSGRGKNGGLGAQNVFAQRRFQEARGDSVNVVNQPFLPQLTETLKPEVIPLWQRPWVRDVARLILGALVLVALALGVLRPLIKNLSTHALTAAPELLPAGSHGQEDRPAVASAAGQPLAYEQQLVQARGLVTQDAKRVAQVVKTWVGEQ